MTKVIEHLKTMLFVIAAIVFWSLAINFLHFYESYIFGADDAQIEVRND